MRAAIWVAGIGGLVVGHILWLVGISLGDRDRDDQHLGAGRGGGVVRARVASSPRWAGVRYRRKSDVWAAFLWGLPVSPVLLSLSVLGVTYL